MSEADLTLRLEAIDVDEVERLAGWATQFGPERIRDEVRGEARLRVIEALAAGSTGGLGRAAYRGAMQAFRGATYLAGEWQSRQAWQQGQAPLVTSDLNEEIDLTRSSASVRRLRPVWSPDGPAPQCLGPVLDRLVGMLADRGVRREAVVEAISVLVDATATRGKAAHASNSGRPRVADVPAREMAERSGLSIDQCRALKTLVIGERSRTDRGRDARPGLLVRAHRGDAVWSDPRALALVEQVAAPRPRMQLGWAERQVPADALVRGA